MADAAQFISTVLSNAILAMVSTPMTVKRGAIVAFVQKELRAIQPPDMPLPYACRNFPNQAFSQMPEGIFPEEFDLTTHLSILWLFGSLRNRIECTDGLFGIYDKDTRDDNSSSKSSASAGPSLRWKVYVARAVERYRRWFTALPASEFSVRLRFVGGLICPMDYGTLIPLDVLMVWHAHMLHPQDYWEDCIRTSRHGIFGSMPFPWLAISHAIGYAAGHGADSDDPQLQYVPPAEAHSNFLRMTQSDFENETDPITMRVTCLGCRKTDIAVEWWNATRTGWVHDGFVTQCPECGLNITKDRLAALQFLDDFSLLSSKGIFMKGTILDYLGRGDRITTLPGFPNLVLGRALNLPRLTLDGNQAMYHLKRHIGDMLDIPSRVASFGLPFPLGKDYDYAFREMFMRYDANPSRFGLDLEAAVHETATFTDSMNALAYFVSPFRTRILNRTSDRFLQFLVLIRNKPGADFAPPCDIDFAWHTMLLNPAAYMATCLLLTGGPVDHVDTSRPSTVADAAKITERTWKKTFTSDAVGFEICTCVYCEAEREFGGRTHGSVVEASNGKKQDPLLEEQYAQACTEARERGSQPNVQRIRMDRNESFAHPYTAPRRRYDCASSTQNVPTKHTTVIDVKGLQNVLGPGLNGPRGSLLSTATFSSMPGGQSQTMGMLGGGVAGMGY
ncbi:uncharacterized protein V1518DRAFT_415590 [Limtongia smithiae]|uniref:uncharacterized protein n=1 Tax=Limtongia smithiae TaxID=1125753 RepID=UPI0034CDABCA